MVKIENREAGILYEELMSRFRRFLGNPTYSYDKHQHHLYEESEHPGISRSYYNECGEVTFTNSNGEVIKFEISRYHGHQHNGCSGLCASPCRDVKISRKVGDELEELWKMHIVCGTLHYSGEVTSLDFPYELLEEQKEEEKKEETKPIVSTEEKSTEVDSVDWDAELTKVSREYDEYSKSRDRIISERDKKIADLVKRIKEEYAIKINDCDNNMKNCREKMESIKNTLNNFSVFDTKMLGYALSQLISTMECSEYYYKEVDCNCCRRAHGPIDSWDEDYKKRVHLITKNKNMRSISEDELSSDDIVLIDPENVTSICSDSFPYVQEFIQYLVKNRIKNGLDNFSAEDMVSLLQSFLESYQDMILEKYKEKIKFKIGNIKLQ